MGRGGQDTEGVAAAAAAAACISQILSKLYTMTTTLINGESIYCSLANSGLLFLCPWHSELH